jgi:hypothetical protein
MAVRSLVILAMGNGDDSFSAKTTLFEDLSKQNMALAFTRGCDAGFST